MLQGGNIRRGETTNLDTNLAVLIDFENIAAGTDKEGLGRFDINAIMSRLVDKGRVLIARSYADWGRFSRFKQALLTANVTMYELTSHGMQDKNRADIAMVVDALELAFTKDYIDTFVIVSGDSDFTPLVLKMRELNKRVIGIGTRSSTSRLLVQACDEFIFYDHIVKSKRKARQGRGGRKPVGRQAGYDLLMETLHGLQRENPQAPLASVIKGALRRKSPDFSESELGFQSFARFLESARDAGYISLERDRKAGGYRVDAADTGVDDEDLEESDSRGGDWTDSYIPAGTEVFVNALKEQGVELLSHPVRMQILHIIETLAKERRSKRRKVTAQYLREDVRKALRNTFPNLPARAIRSVFTSLMQAGLLIHKDGTAIRSASAAFHLEKDAEGLNKELVSTYLAHLEEANADLHNVDLLAELFLGDPERKREIEESLAWLAQAQLGEGDEAALNELDLDSLLSSEPTEAPTAVEPTLEAAPADEPAVVEATADEPVAEEAPKKKRVRKAPAKKPAAPAKKKPATRTRKKPATTAKAAAPEAEAEAPADEEPKKRTRRRVRRKKTEDAPADGNDLDLDSLLESSD